MSVESRAPLRLRGLAIVGAALLAGCANTLEYAPASASRAWTPPSVPPDWRDLAIHGPAASSSGYSLEAPAEPAADRVYDLPALIDLAQRNNPATRIAWGQARQAAAARGIAEATYLPVLSTQVIGGYLSTNRRLPDVLNQEVRVDSSISGVVPILSLEWLLFDFGRRTAANDAARNVSIGANFMFNAMHQKLVYDVTRTYYEYGAARQRSQIAKESLRNSLAVEDAVKARSKAGLATSVETAQARQLVAQARLRQVTSTGLERNAYQALVDRLGVPPDTRMRIADSASVPMPTPDARGQGALLQRALAQRPDIMASIAALKAAENGVALAEADFMPKVYLAGFLLGGRNELSIGPVSGLSNRAVSRGILMGVSLPLYDGGMRSSRVHDAQARVKVAQATLEQLRNATLSEIVVASNLLETALESYDAAETLVSTTELTYDAALDAYKIGMGTVTVATEAANGLLMARSAHAEAHAGAQIAAASLAFALGKLNSQHAPPDSPKTNAVPDRGP